MRLPCQVYLLARWQGARVGRYVKYAQAIQQLLAFLRTAAPAALGCGDLDVAAAARAVAGASPKPEIPESLLTSVETCRSIQEEAARAYADRDTPEQPDPRGAAHARLHALFARVHATLGGSGDASGEDVRVTEDEVLGGGGGSGAGWMALCFMLDLDESFAAIYEAWKRYKEGEIGLVRATLATNSSVAFTQELASALALHSPHLNSLETIVAEIYMQAQILNSAAAVPLYSNCTRAL